MKKEPRTTHSQPQKQKTQRASNVAYSGQVELLKRSVLAWNNWRERNFWIIPILTNAELNRAQLSGANLIAAYLSGANLSDANLRKAKLSKANLSGTDLSEANLEKANLFDANLSRANLSNANLRKAKLSKANLSGANLSGSNLSGADLSGADLSGVNLSGANLSGSDLREANLEKANLNEANLLKTDLRNTKLNNANFSPMRVQGAKLSRKVMIGLISNTLDNIGLNLALVDLSGADLSGIDLSGLNLNGVNFDKANLRKINLKNAKLRGASLRGAQLHEASLAGADLREADLTDADLSKADLTWAWLIRADLTNSNLTAANLRNTAFADAAGSSADLTQATLKDVILTTIGESSADSSFLDLASAKGLNTVDFGDSDFLPQYLTEALDFASRPDFSEKKQLPEFVESVLQRIRALRKLCADSSEPPALLVTTVEVITSELIKYLARHPDALYELRPHQFEELIAEILAGYGWKVDLTPATKDGGYDIFAVSRDEALGVRTSWIIECKKYASKNKVGVDIVRALFGVKDELHVANAMIATTSYFTKGVKDYKASRYDLELKDYEGILDWINTYRPNPNGNLYLKDNRLIIPGEDD